MSERPSDRKEREWQDAVPEDGEDRPESREETYRDGSAKNECWKDE